MEDRTQTEDDASGALRAERSDPHLFLVFAGSAPQQGTSRHVLTHVDEVVFGRGPKTTARRGSAGENKRLSLELMDGRMSSAHARILKKSDGFYLEDTGSRNGTRLNGAPIKSAKLADGDMVELGRTFFRFRASITGSALATADLYSADLTSLPAGMATLLPELAVKLDALARIAERTSSPILLLGETGSGKELLARAIHQLSHRPGKLVAVNCGALPHSLLEGLLFGYTKGAFTGAVKDELGFIRSADGGTLFLDEIGDLPLGSQAALLRVLQEREVTPVGASAGVPVDLRVVAATHAPMEELVGAGEFRSDLYARLAGFEHLVPPLRERKEDFGAIVAALLARMTSENITFTAEAARALCNYSWPRNIRELEHCLSNARVLAQNGEIDVAHLPAQVTKAPQRNAAELDDEALREALRENLSKYSGNISRVARSMGKARMQIQRWMKRFGLDPEEFKQR